MTTTNSSSSPRVKHSIFSDPPSAPDRTPAWRYDAFREMVAQVGGWTVDMVANQEAATVMEASAKGFKRTQTALADVLDFHSRVYAISPQMLTAAMEAAERALYTPIRPPSWPMLPLWIEWEHCYLGADPATATDADLVVGAIFVTAETGWIEERPDAITLRVLLVDPRDQSSKSLLYMPNGTWVMEQQAPCLGRLDCTIGAQTRHPRRQMSMFYVRERADEVEALSCGCRCWRDGRMWARIVWALSHLITAQGVTAQDYDRARPLPPRPRSQRPKDQLRYEADVRRIQTWNRRHPVVRRIAWEQLQTGPARIQREEDGTITLTYPDESPSSREESDARTDVAHIDGRRAHPRLLIVDGIRRWTGKTRVISVQRSRPYDQRVSHARGMPPVRLRVTSDVTPAIVTFDEYRAPTPDPTTPIQGEESPRD